MRRNFCNCYQNKQPDGNHNYAYIVSVLSFEPIMGVDLFSHLVIIEVKDDLLMIYFKLKKDIYEKNNCT